jgi:hypothetical protein
MTDDPPPFPTSPCHRCVHLRLVRSGRGSTFLMCQEPTLPKYPPQPIVRCRGFTAA